MNTFFKTEIILTVYLLLCISTATAQEQKPDYYTPTQSDTWVATDALKRTVGEGIPESRKKNKTVGLFYFIWQGAHGYDHHSASLPDEGVMQATVADSISPYDISEMLRKNPENPAYGPVHAFHYWGQPYLGYYLPNDEWVIRKHGQMISDAGVDVIIVDVTNAAIYQPQVRKICEVYSQMRSEGNASPQIAFIVNSNPKETLKRLYREFYDKGLYKDLWFMWKGKPLLLCPPEGITPDMANFFSIRHSWFASSWDWFGNGKDKWTWADLYPQKAAWHESPDQPEEVSVCAATHPTSNIGRSFHDGKQPAPEAFKSGEGAHFAEQFERALEIDPEFIFITGWNEWVAMRFTNGAAAEMTGKKIKAGDTYFVDQYNEEYSRDIEPMKGGFGDNYYYQMSQFIRRYKGVNPRSFFKKTAKMKMDGNMSKWEKVEARYTDDKGDIFHRSHPGWGRIKSYSNNSGRNDILLSKVASDGKNLYCYVKTDAPISSYTDNRWMRLFLSIKGAKEKDWEGFQYVVNNRVKDRKNTLLEKSTKGWYWEKAAEIKYAVKGNEMELAIPLSSLGITNTRHFTIDFKWIDNAVTNGDIMECMDNGDTAPNGRFRYRFIYQN